MTPDSLRLDLPIIEIDTLRLRPWRVTDAPKLAEAWADPTIAQGAAPPDRSVPGAERWILAAPERCRLGLAVDLVVADRGDDRVVGEVGLSAIDFTRRAALIGWWVGAGARGRGVATEAVGGFSDWALGPARFDALVAEVHVENGASRRVAQLCGYTEMRASDGSAPAAMVRRRENPR